MSPVRPTISILSQVSRRSAALLACLLGVVAHATTALPRILPEVAALSVSAIVDPAFTPSLPGQPTALVPQPDGKVLVMWRPSQHLTASALSRLNADGSIDRSFQLSSYSYGSVSSIELESDGSVLLAGDITIAPSILRAGFVRLLADGSIDGSFKLPAGATGHVLLADGRIVVITINGNVATLGRLDADGSTDSSYPGASITLSAAGQAGSASSYRRVLSARSPSGGYLVAAVSSIGTGDAATTWLFRLQANGAVNTGFSPVSLPGAVQQLVDTGDHVFYVSRQDIFPAGYTLHVGRLAASGAVDGAYATTDGSGGPTSGPIALLMSDGSAVWVADREAGASTVSASTPQALRHINPDGAMEAGFGSTLFTTPSYSHIDQLALDNSGALLVVGSFTAIGGVTTTNLARLVSDPQPYATRLTNLSVRQSSGTGNAILTIGFAIAGAGQKKILARAIGPSLRQFHIAAPLPDPQLAVIDGRGVVQAINDNWDASGTPALVVDTAARVGAFPLAAGSADAATLATLTEGSYSVQVGTNGGTGVTLAEGYDADPAPADYNSARVVNFSARGQTSEGEATLTAGFGIAGPGLKRLLIRAAGPSLAQFGVSGVLADPALTVFTGQTVIGANNDWGGTAELAAAASSVGAFPLSAKDAAVIMTLAEGTYTVQVSSADGASGVALVEVYELR